MERHIVYITDSNYVLPTLVSLHSLVRNTTAAVSVHVVAVELSLPDTELLRSYTSNLVSVEVLDFKNEYKDVGLGHGYVSKAALLKFKLPQIFGGLRRILYVDGDVLLLPGYEAIFDYDIDGYYGAAVEDVLAVVQGKWHERLGHAHYFNSGVMFLNLQNMRDDAATERLVEYKKNDADKSFMDQNAFNAVLGNRMLFIDVRFNFLLTYYSDLGKEALMTFYGKPLSDVEKLGTEAVMIHFTDRKKVWHTLDVVRADMYVPYLDKNTLPLAICNYWQTLKSDFNDTVSELRAQISSSERRLSSLQKQISSLQNQLQHVRHRTLWGFCAYIYHTLLKK